LDLRKLSRLELLARPRSRNDKDQESQACIYSFVFANAKNAVEASAINSNFPNLKFFSPVAREIMTILERINIAPEIFIKLNFSPRKIHADIMVIIDPAPHIIENVEASIFLTN